MRRAYFHASSIASITGALVAAAWTWLYPCDEQPVEGEWTDGT